MRNQHQRFEKVRLILLRTLSVLIGISGVYIDAARAEVVVSTTQAQISAEGAVSEKPEPDDGLWVEVEQSQVLPSDITGVYYLIPYRNRRENWGSTFSIGYSSFTPVSYEPNFVASDYKDIYPTAEMPLIEIQYSIKRNLAIGSLGVEAAVGFYQNKSDSDLIESSIELIPIRLGANLYLDNLWFEPYVVPYVAGGLYTILYEESVAAASYGGNTQVAPYMSVGVQAQMNWIDRTAARISHTDYGIENTFIYIEGRQMMMSQAENDPDFSTGFNWGAGMRLEF